VCVCVCVRVCLSQLHLFTLSISVHNDCNGADARAAAVAGYTGSTLCFAPTGARRIVSPV
jgi:hypothetical protein